MLRAASTFLCGIRTILTLAVILPGFAAGAISRRRTGDARLAANRAFAIWGRWGTRAAGIRLSIEGAEYLESPRPAVFLINHQSGIDPILVAALLRRDFTGVAKQELKRNPVLGPAFVLVAAVFVDRWNTADTAKAFAPAIDALQQGVSIAIAPEGTRGNGDQPGAFKQGGFRLAMEARVPVIPIVLCNSRDVLPPDGWIMRPATVRVVVLPPCGTESWSRADLGDRIESVRQLYCRTLTRNSGNPESPET